MKSFVLGLMFLCIPLSMPQVTVAQSPAGLVTCGYAKDSYDCNFCTFMSMVDKIITFVFTLMVMGAVLMLVYAGFKLVVSQGNEHAMQETKGMISNVIIGFVIVMSAWLIVDTMMKALLRTDSGFGVWNKIGSCK